MEESVKNYSEKNFTSSYQKGIDDCHFIMDLISDQELSYEDLKNEPFTKYELINYVKPNMTSNQIKVIIYKRMYDIIDRIEYAKRMDEHKEGLSKLSSEEWKKRRVYLSELASGKRQGPSTGMPSIDNPWLKFYEEKYYNADIPNESIYDHLKEHITDTNLSALNYFGEIITFEKLLDKIDTYAKAFNELGVKKGDMVSVCLPNVPESVYILYALSKLGAISNIIDPRKKSEQLIHAVNDAKSKAFITCDLFINNTDNVKKELCTKNIFVSPIFDSLSKDRKKVVESKAKEDMTLKDIARVLANRIIQKKYKTISDLENIGRNSNKEVKSVGKAEDVVSIVYTSGTTGESKGVELKNMCYLAMALEYTENIVKAKPGEKILTHVPPFLAYTSLLGTHLPLTLNVCVVMYPDYVPERASDIIYEQGIEHMVGGPADWQSFYNNPDIENREYKLKTLGSGSDTLTKYVRHTINKRLHEAGVDAQIFEGYGLSEASSAAVTNLPNYVVDDSVGIPLPLMNLKVIDRNTLEELPYNTKGEICISGPTLMKCYLNNPDATKDVMFKDVDGRVWLRTGDNGYINEDGNLFFLDRDKAMITLYSGVKVYPVDIEKILLETPYVKECSVVGIDDVKNQRGKIPIANVVLKDEYKNKADSIETTLLKICAKNLPDQKMPKRILVRDQLPQTNVGKIDFVALSDLCNEEINNKVRTR